MIIVNSKSLQLFFFFLMKLLTLEADLMLKIFSFDGVKTVKDISLFQYREMIDFIIYLPCFRSTLVIVI